MLTLAKPNATALPVLNDNAPPAQQPKLLEQMRAVIRTKHYSYSTEKTYLHWAKRFILFHGKRHPSDMGGHEIEAFLSALATERYAHMQIGQQRAAMLKAFKIK